ncbi:contactin-associated protein-like 4 [Lates japonicus]|uniref:Contactin-associated protein-like 4 n=1 Tax=Lates japonicus TaxID=270547 RepID=A0AAD3NGK5_LATJO|nr:contactin-associated protein-like 4 [Lates japonicus]
MVVVGIRCRDDRTGQNKPLVNGISCSEGAGGWSPLSSDSDTGHNWKQYRQEDNIGAFPGNSNADSVVQHKLQHPVIARYVRLIPLAWNPNGRIGLRLETYGCPYNSDVVSFDGHSSLLYRLSPRLRQMARESISLKFKTLRNSGTLLHAEGLSEHSLTLELKKGKLLLVLRKASPPHKTDESLAHRPLLLENLEQPGGQQLKADVRLRSNHLPCISSPRPITPDDRCPSVSGLVGLKAFTAAETQRSRGSQRCRAEAPQLSRAEQDSRRLVTDAVARDQTGKQLIAVLHRQTALQTGQAPRVKVFSQDSCGQYHLESYWLRSRRLLSSFPAGVVGVDDVIGRPSAATTEGTAQLTEAASSNSSADGNRLNRHFVPIFASLPCQTEGRIFSQPEQNKHRSSTAVVRAGVIAAWHHQFISSCETNSHFNRQPTTDAGRGKTDRRSRRCQPELASKLLQWLVYGRGERLAAAYTYRRSKTLVINSIQSIARACRPQPPARPPAPTRSRSVTPGFLTSAAAETGSFSGAQPMVRFQPANCFYHRLSGIIQPEENRINQWRNSFSAVAAAGVNSVRSEREHASPPVTFSENRQSTVRLSPPFQPPHAAIRNGE